MFARMNIFTRLGGDFDRGVELFREEVTPRVEKLPGFAGTMLLGSRADGVGYAITFWESEEAMAASRDVGRGLADAAAETLGATVTTTECEVPVAKLPLTAA